MGVPLHRLVALVLSLALTVTGLAAGPARAASITAPVTVVSQPADLTVALGQEATFESHATDAAGVAVQVLFWQRNADDTGWQDIPGTAGESRLVLGAVPVSADGTTYRAVFDDGIGGVVASDAARLDVITPPTVDKHPLGVTVAPGGPFSLSVSGTGDPTPAVQWQRAASADGPWTDVGGANSTTLSLEADPTPQTTVWYRAVLTNPAGTESSSAAAVTTSLALAEPVSSVSVSNPAPGRLSASWPTPSGGPVSHYLVVVRQGGSVVTSTSTAFRSVSFSLPAGSYTVSVTASNAAGNAAPTSSDSVTVHNLAVAGSVSSTSVYPFADGYRDSVTLRATSNFAVSGQVKLLTSGGATARSWTLSPAKSWSIPFSGRTADGRLLPYGAYTVRFSLGGRSLPATTLTIRRTEATLTSATWAYPTVYPVKDGYRDTVKLTIKADKPVTTVVTYTKSGSLRIVGTATLSRRTSGTLTWSARAAGAVVSAGRYRAKIVVKGGDGSARTYYRHVNVSLKKITAARFTGTISATGAYIATIAGAPVRKSSGRVEVRWSSSSGSDIALMGARLPPSFQNRYSGIALHACVDTKFSGNAATVLFADAQVSTTSRKVEVPDSGCAQAAFPVSYVTDRQVYWYTGNFSGQAGTGVLDRVDLTLTRYLLK